MKTVIKLLSISLVLIMIGCEKSSESKSEINGHWIELINHQDTISFLSWDSEDVFKVQRGYEMVNGYMLPKYGAGIYSFKLTADSIMINNMMWNCMCFPSHYFKMNTTGDTFQIGNFYDTTEVATQWKTFFKIE